MGVPNFVLHFFFPTSIIEGSTHQKQWGARGYIVQNQNSKNKVKTLNTSYIYQLRHLLHPNCLHDNIQSMNGPLQRTPPRYFHSKFITHQIVLSQINRNLVASQATFRHKHSNIERDVGLITTYWPSFKDSLIASAYCHIHMNHPILRPFNFVLHIWHSFPLLVFWPTNSQVLPHWYIFLPLIH